MPELSALLLIFSFQFSLLFFSISLVRPHQHCSVLYRTSDVAENLSKYLLVRSVKPRRKNFKVILTVKMEIRHPVERPFGSDFTAICNHCRVMNMMA